MKQKPFALRYREVEAIIAEIHQVESINRVALTGRVKNLQGKGWPPNTKTGRGKIATYSAESLIQLLVACELIALRISPDHTVQILSQLDWSLATNLCLAALADEPAAQPYGEVLLVFDPDGLSPLKGEESATCAEWLSLPDDADRLDAFRAGRRFVAVNVSRMLADATQALHQIRDKAAPDDEILRRTWDFIKRFDPIAELEARADLSPELRDELARLKAALGERKL